MFAPRTALAAPLALLLLASSARAQQAPAPNRATPAAAAPQAAPDTAPTELCLPLPDDSTARLAPLSSLGKEEQPQLRLPADVRPTEQVLSLEIDPDAARFSGTTAIALVLDRPRGAIWLHGRGLHVTEARLDLQGARLVAKWEQVTEQGLARVLLPCAVSGRALLTVSWDAPFGEHLAGLYLAREAGLNYASTQFEAVDARRAFPCFDDPAFKIPWELELLAPAADVVIANSLPLGTPKIEGTRQRVQFATTPPLPSYLVAFAVGPFDVVTPPPLPPNEVRKTPLQVRGLAPKGRGGELQYAMQVSTALLPMLESWFGIPFPYDKLDHIALPDFDAGAMENAGAITYREQGLLYRLGVSGMRARIYIAQTMAHEMAHQWFGDLVTLRWWTDAWLNESFASWMETKIVQEWKPDYRVAIEQLERSQGAMEADSLTTARAIRKPVESEDAIWNQFDGLTYEKGAGLLAMFERWSGPAAFRQGLQSYLRAHQNGSGSSEELFAALSAAAKKDVQGPLQTFLDQPGAPMVHMHIRCGGKGEPSKVMLEQKREFLLGARPTPAQRAQLWKIPICVRGSAHGNGVQACGLLEKERGELLLPGPRCPEWIMPNEGATGSYRFALGPLDLRQLIAARTRLTPPERISLASNLAASLYDGSLPPAEVLPALETLAHDEEPGALSPLLEIVEEAHHELLPDAQHPVVEAYARSLFGGAARKLSWAPEPAEEPRARELRVLLARFLAFTARDPELRAEGRARGLAYANLGGQAFDDSAVAPELAAAALTLALEGSDEAMRQKLVERLASSEESPVRRRILEALAGQRDPALTPQLLALALDPRLHTNERSRLLGQLDHEETREAAYRWLREHWDELVGKLSETSAAGLVGELAQVYCEEDRVAAVQEFLAPRAEKIPAAGANLERGLEEARLCIARRSALEKELHAYFARAKKA